MSTVERIVVGVDGSPASLQALRWAAGQAALTHASVRAVTSWSQPAGYAMEYVGDDIDWAENGRAILDDALAAVGDETSAGVERSVVEGEPAHVLVDASAGADLLVVGSRGHGGFTGLLLGSVSDYVIAHAACPVLVVRTPQPVAV
jgi:nucleotide-binding universal stress UspA family protein